MNLNLKLIVLTIGIACLGVSVNVETASANSIKAMMSGARTTIGCDINQRAARAMRKHPERWGKPPSSLVVQR